MKHRSVQFEESTQTILSRAHFFETQVHMKEWKDSMSSKDEDILIKVLESAEFKLGEDFQRQQSKDEKTK